MYTDKEMDSDKYFCVTSGAAFKTGAWLLSRTADKTIQMYNLGFQMILVNKNIYNNILK